MGKFKDLTGLKFGRLTVIKMICVKKDYSRIWECVCECGKIKNVIGANLINGNTSSCGCLKYERISESNLKHGYTNSKLYLVWNSMKSRCLNKNRKGYENYGGRGILICDEWLDFTNFKDWALENGYKEGLTIDRINNNWNYEPSNCRWATQVEQNNNKRTNLIVEGTGMTLSQYCKKHNLNYKLISKKNKKNKSVFELIPYEIKIRN